MRFMGVFYGHLALGWAVPWIWALSGMMGSGCLYTKASVGIDKGF